MRLSGRFSMSFRHLTALARAGMHRSMFPALPPRRTLIETAETLAIALAGGVTFTLLRLPAGLVSGSVLAVAAAALLGRPVRMPLPLARICYVVVGTLLGAVVTPETLRGVDDLAGEHCASHAGLARHDRRDHGLFARGASLGSVFGAAWVRARAPWRR